MVVDMDLTLKSKAMKSKKLKGVSKVLASEPKMTLKNLDKVDVDLANSLIKAKKLGKNKKIVKKNQILNIQDITEKYPILKDVELMHKFLSVTMTNNQKGRIRQVLKDSLSGTTQNLLPDVINQKIQSILKSSTTLSDSDLRKLRILYNMLKTAIEALKSEHKDVTANINIGDNKKTIGAKEDLPVENGQPDKVKQLLSLEEKKQLKKLRNKRYVLFLGNLPPDVNKEKIMNHFSEINECIKDIRIPKQKEERKSAIAYLELVNEPTYELALSKHHSMMGKKRINVQYSMQKKSKISKTEAKSKSAKLIALQKSGVLLGSTPLTRRRSQRRKKLKQARAKEANSGQSI